MVIGIAAPKPEPTLCRRRSSAPRESSPGDDAQTILLTPDRPRCLHSWLGRNGLMRRTGRLAATLLLSILPAASVHAAKPPADVTRFDPRSVRPTPQPSTSISTAIC